VLYAIIQDAAEVAELPKPSKKEMQDASVRYLSQLQELNEQVERDINNAIKSALAVPGDDPRFSLFKETLIESYAQIDGKDRYSLAELVTTSLWNQFSN